MNIIDSHIHICRCINGFGNSGEMQAIGGGYASHDDDLELMELYSR